MQVYLIGILPVPCQFGLAMIPKIGPKMSNRLMSNRLMKKSESFRVMVQTQKQKNRMGDFTSFWLYGNEESALVK